MFFQLTFIIFDAYSAILNEVKTQPVYKHNLVNLLRSFSKSELKKLMRFLSSPYFAHRDSIKILLKELIKYHPLYTDIRCTRENLYKKVYPQKKYNADSLRDLFSSLLKAVLKFIITEGTTSDPYVFRYVAKELRERSTPGLGLKKIKNMDSEFDSMHGIDSDFFFLKYRLEIEKFNYGMAFDKIKSSRPVIYHTERLKQANIYIIVYALLEILSTYINLIIYSEKYGVMADDKELKSIINDFPVDKIFALAHGKSKYDYIIEIYKALLNAFEKTGSFEAFTEYKKLVMSHSNKLSFDEISFHYSRMISCAILGEKYGEAKNEFRTELLALYETFLKKSYYIDKKTYHIPQGLFRAIILHALKMNKVDWLHKIIIENTDNIQPAEKENMKYFAMAYYYFATGQRGKAIENITKLKITNFVFKYDIYTLKLKIFFEEKSYNAALEIIHTFRQFLRNDKIMPNTRKVFHLNFVKYYEKLLKLAEGSKKDEAGLLIKKIEKNLPVANRDWLIDKLSVFAQPAKKYTRAG